MSDDYSVGEFLGEFVSKEALISALNEAVAHLNQVAKNCAFYMDEKNRLQDELALLKNKHTVADRHERLRRLYNGIPLDVLVAAEDYVRAGFKIKAIKALRVNDCVPSLSDAKEIVEEYIMQ